MAGFAGPNIIEDGLVFAVDAGNTKSYPGSGTAWTDLSGNSNNGTLTNGPTYSSDNGGSIVFDGSNDYVNLSFNTEYTNISINAWVTRDQLNVFNSILGKYGSGASDSGYELIFNNSGGVRFHTSADSIDSTSLSADTWYHIVGTYDGSTSRIYINGSFNVSGTTSHNSNTINWRIGSSMWGGNYFDGDIAQAMIYNRALSAAEVAQNYNATKGRYGL